MPPPPAVPDPPDAGQRWRPGRDDPAGELLRWWLDEQVRAVRAAEGPGGGAPDVHDLRVAMRRARSALATFRPLVDASRTEPLRAELQWAASELGRVRDAEVVLERVAAHAPAAAGIDGAELARRGHRALTRALEQDLESRRPHVLEVLASRRYRSALAGLEALAADPPLTARAADPARRVARRRIRQEGARFDRLAREALAEPDTDGRAALLHDARKAAKRLRYAAEAAAPVTGRRVVRIAEAAEHVQEVLGEHHDTVATRVAVAEVARAGDVATAFAVGRVHSLEEAEALRLEAVAEVAVRRLHRRSGV
ncbi:CHAD domain-containing protein [Intrasporangium sp. YIM S08009]|uniref:CHAD domain-containing protein n=1 Tax=Intrasporangium zincisolvens TaxID=3080018 RepID=UPI002B0535A9|nr:CHAD domain-containing protein [Intrasporangium sp. YIM S08009]